MDHITITTTQFVLFILLTVGASFLSVGIQVGIFIGWKNEINKKIIEIDGEIKTLSKTHDTIIRLEQMMKTVVEGQERFQTKFDQYDEATRRFYETYELKRKRTRS